MILHRFELETLAGSGGMAMVYRARDHATGRTVALKLLHGSGRDPREMQRFEREGQLLAALRHPAIVAHVAHGHTPAGQPFLAMEWLQGEDLARRLAAAPLGLAESLTLAHRIAGALATAHRAGVIHRDIKPSNLFLRDGDVERVTLLDFGVAHLSLSPPMTRTGIAIGTPGYMAPEQARGERELGPGADIFSLGCVLFECLTGQPPFVADHVAALLAKILFEDAPLLRTRRPELPEPLEALLARMLAKDPAQRPRDAALLAVELAELAALRTVEPRPAERPTAAPALAGTELQFLSVILAVPDHAPVDTQATLTAERARVEYTELRAELLPQGFKIECLADGSIVATLAQTGHRTATDQAVQSVRCALLIKERWPHAIIALVTSRGTLRGALPVGEALSRAARLVAAPLAPGPVAQLGLRLDDVTAGLVESAYAIDRVATGCYLLLGERSSLDETRPLLGKPTPCVGREQELALLDMLLAGCIEDRAARAMLITAPPGVGKSRLRHEFLRRTRIQRPELTVLVGRGDPISAGAPYGLLARALRQHCDVRDGLSDADSQARLERGLGRRLPPDEAPRVVRFLGELCGVPFADPDDLPLRAARQAPELMSEQIQRAFLDFLRAECAAQPVVLVLEDLHWSDRLTVRLCDVALRELDDRPLLVLALARPEVRELFPRLWDGRERQQLELGGLRRRACEQLIQRVLGAEVSQTLLTRVVEQAGGNALFLEELIRAVAEDKGEALPETVLAMLQVRFLRLDAGARRALHAASVFGETFWRGGVAALVGEGAAAELDHQLAALLDAELLERRSDTRLAGEVEYAFRHALVRDAAYALLTAEDQVLGHRLAASYLERAGERDPMVIAEHFTRGHDSARAGLYYVRAVELARYAGDPATAIALAERGLRCELPDPERVALEALIVEEHGWRGDFEAGAIELLARCVPGSVAWTAALAAGFSAALFAGDLARARQLGDQLVSVRVEPAALANLSFTMMAITVLFTFAGEHPRVAPIVRRQDALLDPLAADEPLADAWRWLSHAIFDAHDVAGPEAALAAGRRGEAAFARMQHRRGALAGRITIGLNLTLLGQYAAAEAALRSTFVVGVDYGPYAVYRTAAVIAALVGQGALAEAVREAEAFIAGREGAHTLGPIGVGLLRRELAEALARQGDRVRAEAEARTACHLLAPMPGDRHLAATTLAAILLGAGQAAAALEQVDEVLAARAAHDLRPPQQPATLLIRAEALHALGRDDEARAALAAAHADLSARAARIGAPELRASYLTAIPEHARIVALAAAWAKGRAGGKSSHRS
ncbi:protein kinase [Nannocystis sp. ILAH1]|uniref:serine/threonine-protein kinase n=1 Tax=Nannocystis sp. ILAH1 TaxID=2996789 RepID=UPI00227028DE|nr:serine/threonine-protein kinase [Nannocystis sp. ILAH1]MCY0991102.1 protein kinase [Nannocystis sp. ILAH1]